MTAVSDDVARGSGTSADGSLAAHEDMDQAEPQAAAAPSVTRVPLHGPVDTYDVMCAKVIFALCGSVFPHPLLLAQHLLGVEDQDFPEFLLNVAEAGNNCIDIVAAYLTNLRVMQQEDDPNPPVSLAMIQPRHAATVASVAAKARDLMSELALARATVKPRKAPKNKAIESAARAAAAAAASATSPVAPASTASPMANSTCAGNSGGGALAAAEGVAVTGSSASTEVASSGLLETPLDAVPVAFCEDFATCSESADDASSCCGHQDTSREGGTGPRTAREEEERLLYALQGPAAAEETLKMARARPSGCKGGPSPAATSSDTRSPGVGSGSGQANGPQAVNASPNGNSSTHQGNNGHSTASNHHNHQHQSAQQSGNANAVSGGGASAAISGSPRSVQPPPPPTRTSSSMAQYVAAQGSSPSAASGNGNGNNGSGGGGGRHSQELGRSGGAGRGPSISQSGSGLHTALSCPVTGLPEMLVAATAAPSTSPPANGGHGHHGGGHGHAHNNHQSSYNHHNGQGHRRNGGGGGAGGQHNPANTNGGPAGGGRRNNAGGGGGGGGGSTRASPSGTPAQMQQQLQLQEQQQQQQQLAVAQLLGLRTPYGNNAYGNLVAYATAAAAAGGLSPFGGASSSTGRLDLNLNSMAATTAALELAAAQQAALNVAAANGLHHLNQHMGGFGAAAAAAAAAAGFGGQAGLGQLAGQLGGGLGGLPLMHHHHHQQQQQQQQAAAAQQHAQHAQHQQAAAAAAAAALLQGGDGMLLAESIKGAAGAGAAADWSNVLLQAQLAAGSLG